MQLQFFQWVTTYSGIMSNLYGKDREEAISHMDDDAAFDKWLVAFDRKQKAKMGDTGKDSGKVRISQEEYVARYAKVHGGEGET